MLALCAGMLGLPVTGGARAQFGFPGLPTPRGLPLPGVRVGPGLGLPLPGLYGRNGLGRTLGFIGAVAVGAIILRKLSLNDRREVARRARVVVERDRNDRVVDTYNSRDGRHQVTMTAEPVQNASEFVEDPALQKFAEAKAETSTTAKSTAKGKAPEEEEIVDIKALPVETACRRVTTDYESKPPAPNPRAKPQPMVTEAKQTNVSIMCETQKGTWKPAGA